MTPNKTRDEQDRIVDSFRDWEKTHNRENYGRYDAYKAGHDAAEKQYMGEIEWLKQRLVIKTNTEFKKSLEVQRLQLQNESLKVELTELRDHSDGQAEEIQELLGDVESLKADLAMAVEAQRELKNSLMGFVEYFSAIQRGEYNTNRRPSPLRDFEQVLLTQARQTLSTLKTKLGPSRIVDVPNE
jgi:chromosome segregation ATPase